MLNVWAINAQTWEPDPDHTTFQFRAKHYGLTEITGRFKDYKIDFKMAGEDFLTASLVLEIKTKSLDSQNPFRDEHLRGKDFFDVQKYPTMIFRSKQVFPGKRKNEYEIVGDLTVKNITRPVTVSIRTGKPINDLKGDRRIGFGGFTIINRYDFGMDFDVPLEDGTPLVSQEVNIDIGIELIKRSSK